MTISKVYNDFTTPRLEMTAGQLNRLVEAALEEDLGWGDLTTDYFVPANVTAQARFVARQPGVMAGLDVARAVYQAVDPQIRFNPTTIDGATLEAGQTLATVEGSARSLLKGERVALNFLTTPERYCNGHFAFCRSGGRYQSPHRGHSQDHAPFARP